MFYMYLNCMIKWALYRGKGVPHSTLVKITLRTLHWAFQPPHGSHAARESFHAARLTLTLLYITKPHKIYLQNTQHVVLRNRPTLSIGTERLACLNNPPWRAAGDPRLARGRSRARAPGPAGALRALFFSTLPSFLLREIVFFAPSPPNPRKC